MNIELPNHLRATTELLAGSFKGRSLEQAPSIPRGLLEDLTRSHKPHAASAARTKSPLSRIWELFAAPSFGRPAMALGAVALASILFFGAPGSERKTETYRGTQQIQTGGVATLVLITDDAGFRSLLEESGMFEMESVIQTTDPLVACSVATSKLIVDVRSGNMVGYDAESREVLSDELPDDRTRVAERIATAFGALR